MLEDTDLTLDERGRVKSLGSKKAWRKSEEKEQKLDDDDESKISFRDVAWKRTQKARNVLQQRWKELQYKGRQFTMEEPATTSDIDAMFLVLAKFIPSKPWEKKNFCKVQFLRDPTVKKFFDDHVKLNKYSLQIKKCSDPTCPFHKQPRADDFHELKWMPTPTLTVKNGRTKAVEEYKTYEETIGEDPVDNDCPSVKGRPRNCTVEKIALPKPTFKIAKQYARRVVSCTLCMKRRILYSRSSLKSEQVDQLDEVLEQSSYACGQLVFPTGHVLEHVVFQPVQTKCSGRISPQYYKIRPDIVGWRWICSVCLIIGDGDDAAVETSEYKGLPRCVVCKDDGCDSTRARRNAFPMARKVGTVAAAAEDAEPDDAEVESVAEDAEAEDAAEDVADDNADAGARAETDIEGAEADDDAEVEYVAEDAEADDAAEDGAEADANAGEREEEDVEVDGAEANDAAEAESVAEDAEAEDVADANAGARAEADVEGAADVDDVEDDALPGRVRRKSQTGRRTSKRHRTPNDRYIAEDFSLNLSFKIIKYFTIYI